MAREETTVRERSEKKGRPGKKGRSGKSKGNLRNYAGVHRCRGYCDVLQGLSNDVLYVFSGTKYSASKDIPVQYIHPVTVFQYNIFSQ
jgi:hypothetical protein